MFNYSKPWVMVLVFSFLAMLGTFFRPVLFGNDSYASWACISRGWCETLSWQPGAVAIFELMPPILILAKIIMVLSLFISIWFIFLTVKHFFDERSAFIAIFFSVALCPIIIFEFSKFENELFALPLVFAGFYFLLTGKWKHKILGVGCWLASFWFWLWPGYFFMKGVNVWPGIMEQQLFSGLMPLLFGILALPFVFMIKNNWLRVIFVLFLLGGLLSGKIAILLIVFVALGFAQIVELLEE